MVEGGHEDIVVVGDGWSSLVRTTSADDTLSESVYLEDESSWDVSVGVLTSGRTEGVGRDLDRVDGHATIAGIGGGDDFADVPCRAGSQELGVVGGDIGNRGGLDDGIGSSFGWVRDVE